MKPRPRPVDPDVLAEPEYYESWGVAWLTHALQRRLTPLEAKLAGFFQDVFHGIYHVDGVGWEWQKWLGIGRNDYAEILTHQDIGTRGAASAWGDVEHWVEAAKVWGLRFRITAARNNILRVSFWHETGRL